MERSAYPFYCDLCRIGLMTKEGYEVHLLGRPHQQRMLEGRQMELVRSDFVLARDCDCDSEALVEAGGGRKRVLNCLRLHADASVLLFDALPSDEWSGAFERLARVCRACPIFVQNGDHGSPPSDKERLEYAFVYDLADGVGAADIADAVGGGVDAGEIRVAERLGDSDAAFVRLAPDGRDEVLRRLSEAAPGGTRLSVFELWVPLGFAAGDAAPKRHADPEEVAALEKKEDQKQPQQQQQQQQQPTVASYAGNYALPPQAPVPQMQFAAAMQPMWSPYPGFVNQQQQHQQQQQQQFQMQQQLHYHHQLQYQQQLHQQHHLQQLQQLQQQQQQQQQQQHHHQHQQQQRQQPQQQQSFGPSGWAAANSPDDRLSGRERRRGSRDSRDGRDGRQRRRGSSRSRSPRRRRSGDRQLLGSGKERDHRRRGEGTSRERDPRSRGSARGDDPSPGVSRKASSAAAGGCNGEAAPPGEENLFLLGLKMISMAPGEQQQQQQQQRRQRQQRHHGRQQQPQQQQQHQLQQQVAGDSWYISSGLDAYFVVSGYSAGADAVDLVENLRASFGSRLRSACSFLHPSRGSKCVVLTVSGDQLDSDAVRRLLPRRRGDSGGDGEEEANGLEVREFSTRACHEFGSSLPTSFLFCPSADTDAAIFLMLWNFPADCGRRRAIGRLRRLLPAMRSAHWPDNPLDDRRSCCFCVVRFDEARACSSAFRRLRALSGRDVRDIFPGADNLRVNFVQMKEICHVSPFSFACHNLLTWIANADDASETIDAGWERPFDCSCHPVCEPLAPSGRRFVQFAERLRLARAHQPAEALRRSLREHLAACC